MPFLGLLLVVGLFVGLLAIFEADNVARFLSLRNLQTIVTQSVIVGIGALGMTVVISGGGIDLSAGSQIALSSVVCALVLVGFGGEAGEAVGWVGVVVALLASLVVGGLVGVFNGGVTCALRLPPFIVTLGTMMMGRGVAEWVAGQVQVRTPANPLQDFMARNPEPEWLIFAPGVWLLLVLLVAVGFLLRWTVFGRYVYAMGNNETAARFSGVPVAKVRIWTYVLAGGFFGVAGAMSYAFLGSGDPTTGVAKELDIIAAVVIGGGSLSGGRGSALGSVVGALIMTVLVNGCSMLNVPDPAQKVIIGAIIIGAVGVDEWRKRKS
ncbi:MAG: ABC transporter permease [Verrucomicrobiales bacterium]|nr:ABC transporter permease [Verrucomicrobiales bacterium]